MQYNCILILKTFSLIKIFINKVVALTAELLSKYFVVVELILYYPESVLYICSPADISHN